MDPWMKNFKLYSSCPPNNIFTLMTKNLFLPTFYVEPLTYKSVTAFLFTVCVCIFWQKNIEKKAPRKILMILTHGLPDSFFGLDDPKLGLNGLKLIRFLF